MRAVIRDTLTKRVVAEYDSDDGSDPEFHPNAWFDEHGLVVDKTVRRGMVMTYYVFPLTRHPSPLYTR